MADPQVDAKSRNPTASPQPDARTLERARQGDVEAFEQIYRAYAGRIYALCRRLSGDSVRAEDLVQETFLRVERIDTFEARSRFTTWLYRLAVNRSTDLLRPEIRRSLHETSEELAEARMGGGPIAGIVAAQSLHPGAAWLVLACDLPLLDGVTLSRPAAGRSRHAPHRDRIPGRIRRLARAVVRDIRTGEP